MQHAGREEKPRFSFRHSWSARDVLIGAVLFLGVLGLYSLDWAYSLSDGSHNLQEGVSSFGAERVLAGDIPYRDFWTMYAPGHFYLVALLFRAFGTNLWVEVVAASVVCAAVASLCYYLVMNLVGIRIPALACAVIFVAATYNTGYFRRLGSYPPAIFMVLATLNLMVLYYRVKKVGLLVAAGLATGVMALFKHDVAGYTAIAVVVGLIIDRILVPKIGPSLPAGASIVRLLLRLFIYMAGVVVIVVPPLIYFAIVAGPDMLQDLIVFPLTDFRFARPEGYPSLLPLGIWEEARLQTLNNFFNYLNLTVPFGLFILGLFSTGWAVRRREPVYAATGVTFLAAYLIHYRAAHIQINTHVITMSVYAAFLAAIGYDLVQQSLSARRRAVIRLLSLGLLVGWMGSLIAKPAYLGWQSRRQATVELALPKASGFKVTPQEARTLAELSDFVGAHIPPDQKLFVGLHRHDVIIIGDIMAYFLLDRPSATRYQELHPAIADSALVQQEIIDDLVRNDVSFIVLKHISLFSDEELELAKEDFLRNLPQVGATQLDGFIRQNYHEIRKFGPYEVWERKSVAAEIPVARPNLRRNPRHVHHSKGQQSWNREEPRPDRACQGPRT